MRVNWESNALLDVLLVTILRDVSHSPTTLTISDGFPREAHLALTLSAKPYTKV